jgi:pilus assembly protein CpaC
VRSHRISAIATALLLTVAALGAQAPQPSQAQVPAAVAPLPAPAQAPSFEKVVLTAGRSTVITTEFDVTRIAVTNPAVADAVVVQPREVLIDGKSAGTVSLIIWGVGRRVQYDLVVELGVSTLQQQLQTLFPGEDINATLNADALVLWGRVSSTAVMLKAAEIAAASSSKTKVINLLQLPGAAGSQQVMLQVRFAEVNRRAIEELGSSFFTGATGYKDYIGRTTTQQFAAPDYADLSRKEDATGITLEGKTTFSDFLNLFLFNTKHNVGMVIKALESKGFFQSLAEPNLIAYNGQQASFLAGGEFPVPVVQGITNTVTIQWKEFGVRLSFTPTIAGDLIRLNVKPEVSSLDFNNGLTLQGYRIPSLITRRAETDVELRDGQSFAIAGLLHNTGQDDRAGIPILSQIPIIGALFKSKAERKEQTELMVLITPRLVRPLDPDEVPALPTMPASFIKDGSNAAGPGALDAPPVTAKAPIKKQ